MQLAVKRRDASRAPDKRMSPKPLRRYTLLSESASGGRAETRLALPVDVDTLDKLVVIKSFLPELPGAPQIADEVSLAARLDHENIARTLSIGYEAGRYFIVREYLEGITLRSLLGWSRLSGQAIPNAAVVRILLGIVDALEHGARAADSAGERALIHQPVSEDDVFITYDGAVKLLGFKAVQGSELRVVPGVTPPDESSPRALTGSGAQTAVDALLSSQLTPELSRMFARMATPMGSVGEDGFQQVLEALHDWQLEELAGDGRAELAAIMAQAWPEARARHTAQLQAALCELRARRGEASLPRGGEQDVAPVSERRTRGSPASRGASGAEAAPSASAPLASAAGSGAERVSDDGSGEPVAAQVNTPKRSRRRAVAALLAGASFAALGALYLQSGSGGMTAPPQPSPAPLQTPLASLDQGSADAPRAAAPAVSPAWESPGTASLDSSPELSKSVPAPDPGEPGAVGPVASASERPTRQPPPSQPKRHVASLVPARPGYLTLDTTPWSNVALGGASLGQTPLVGVELPPGEHLLELVNPELGLASRYIVTITSGVTTARRVGLEQPRAR